MNDPRETHTIHSLSEIQHGCPDESAFVQICAPISELSCKDSKLAKVKILVSDMIKQYH